MMTAQRALALNVTNGAPMPRADELRDLYADGWQPRRGELLMIAGRPGSQKSGFAMWLVSQWNLPTLYFSGDMSAFTASARIASMHTGMTTDEIEKAILSPEGVKGYGRSDVLEALEKSKITFSFGEITWRRIDAMIEAYVEVHNAYPDVIVIDNLMDVEGCDSGYAEQMEAMQAFAAIKTGLGINVVVLHHCSDASWDSDDWRPPKRKDIKNKVGEKPECVLTVAFNPIHGQLNVAIVKQRSGASDALATSYTTLTCKPEVTQFEAISSSHGLHPISRESHT